MGFDAVAYLLTKFGGEDRWDRTEVRVFSVADIHAAVGGKAEQVDLDVWHKVYYNGACYADSGVVAHVRDCQSNIQFLPSPLLLVLCDDEKPVDCSEESYGDFFDWVTLL